MKKTLFFMCVLFFIISFSLYPKAESTDFPYLKPVCPVSDELIKTNDNDKDELLQKLNKLIPDAYPDDIYSEWIVKEAKPLRSLIGVPYEEAYYGMANKLCNKKTANYSWLIKVEFPKLLPSASAASGVMFVIKDKDNGWHVWYTYR
ncbi:hypothetical protein JSQ81_10295 [Sporosarcina sp. Marseille-Q4063]|uniref:hypothetical protein n=1 Tax=Sporosarcina sp. Marseille-Q4063 TaxID=2810514 RepID=UPI001BB064D4|nr:hypothetical protein [Sporosarcina sp. Marseille-Q4063]QUW20270.1 hypothetical protein JSQ81_10295 [Sporosarcina sp. Marseille-Q4063]